VTQAQENEMNIAVKDQQGNLNGINENACVVMTLNANADNIVSKENLSGRRSEVLTVIAKTQEMLTLVESQLDNYDEYSQDEHFSQVSKKLANKAPTQIPCTQDDHSQTQNDQFSQEDNTANKQFSQFTHKKGLKWMAEVNRGDTGDEGGKYS
jgi:hypothetical protein